MTLECIVATDVATFSELVWPFLLEREVEHNLIIGTLRELAHFPDTYLQPPYMAAVLLHGQVVACGVMTPPHKLVISRASAEAAELLAADLAARGARVPGFSAPRPSAFGEAWRGQTGQRSQLQVELRIYQLTHVMTPVPARGRLQRAKAADLPRIRTWLAAFNAEAMHEHGTPADYAALARRWIESPQRSLAWWIDDKPVCMIGVNYATPNGARIGPVYTPPALRGRGYASNAVAALSQQVLDGGRAFVSLYTDLANPTSNGIYQAIGFVPVADTDDYAFVAS